MKKVIQKLLQPRKKIPKKQNKQMANLSSVDLFGKTILLRCDFNVPIHHGKIQDNYKIKQSLPTIKELLKRRCKIVIISHMGRPDGKSTPKYSLKPVAKELTKLLPKKTILFQTHCLGKEVKEQITHAKQGQIILLENLRFYAEEKAADLSFAHSLAELADIYIFDAFAVAHRKHSSTAILPLFIPTAQGLLVQDEVETINAAKAHKDKSIWIIGGAKLDKLSVIKSALKHAEWVYIGGAICFSFLRAKGAHVGHSKFTAESVKIAKKILESENAQKIILPTDIVCSNSLSTSSKATTVLSNEIPSSAIGLDIGKESISELIKLIKNARQIVWNGPLGYTEDKKYQHATNAIIQEIKKTDARTIIGGGETSEILAKNKARNAVTHASTGGGATLALLSGRKLPALEALVKSAKKFNLLK